MRRLAGSAEVSGDGNRVVSKIRAAISRRAQVGRGVVQRGLPAGCRGDDVCGAGRPQALSGGGAEDTGAGAGTEGAVSQDRLCGAWREHRVSRLAGDSNLWKRPRLKIEVKVSSTDRRPTSIHGLHM